MQLSTASNIKIKSLTEEMSTGKAYLVCLENKPISNKGFKTQSDIQKFIDHLETSIVAVSAEKNPTSIYLKTSLFLLSFVNAKGETLPLTKFRFNFKKQ